MYFTKYSQTEETSLVDAQYHAGNSSDTIIEKTEDLPQQVRGNEQKVSFRESGGNAYVKNAVLLQSSEFTILGTEDINGIATTLSVFLGTA